MKNNSLKIRSISVTAVMGALGAILMFIEIPIPVIIPSFIKFDFSDLPALITTFAFGPSYGVLSCLLKNLLHLLTTSSGGIGELSNFILGSIFVFTAGMIYKHKHNRKWAFIGATVGALAMGIICLFTNYYIIYPLYSKVLGLPTPAILGMYREILPSVNGLFAALCIFNLPFTFIKGLIDTLLCFLMYKPLSPILKGNNRK